MAPLHMEIVVVSLCQVSDTATFVRKGRAYAVIKVVEVSVSICVDVNEVTVAASVWVNVWRRLMVVVPVYVLDVTGSTAVAVFVTVEVMVGMCR